MHTPRSTDRLLGSRPADAGPELLSDHLERLGPLPSRADSRSLVGTLERSGLLGRGGAGFPLARKWGAVADRAGGHAVVVANGAEGEPRSAKDRALMALRPHLVLDGALLAAQAVGADEVVFYVGIEHRAATASMTRAIGQRRGEFDQPVRLVPAPLGYVSGEASAVVRYLESGDARPTSQPPRPSERGLGGRPTLVQNVESLAHAALIARFGDAWYRDAGRGETRGTALVTASGAGIAPTVREIAYGTTVGELGEAAGLRPDPLQAVMLGGYFGGWAAIDTAWDEPLDPLSLRQRDLAFGCGMVAFLDRATCGVVETARIMEYMAGESAGQCGPCLFGLRAIADATTRLATGVAAGDDLERIDRWSSQLAGRGACHHPDGAVGLLRSALRVFPEEFALHQRTGRCSAHGAATGRRGPAPTVTGLDRRPAPTAAVA